MNSDNERSPIFGPAGEPLPARRTLGGRMQSASRSAKWLAGGLAAGVATLALFLTNVDFIFSRFHDDTNAKTLVALSRQAEVEPPYYGDSDRGNVRPQMEAYIRSFVFPAESPGRAEAETLLRLIEERGSPASQGYFRADNEFRAALASFRGKVRQLSTTGAWPQ